ncbi:MAG: hypothetical protein UW24_C0012G0033 [Parcubacteria group bacterium GW2011_GWA2_44_12]|nr:MAG: hypothetical protein UW24_C0012G0033 [Parcubacteria group bacterium GW2011_GWA2_44_12]
MQTEIQNFIKKRPYLFWSVNEYDDLSENALVSAVLNYGNFQDVQTLISLLGIKKTADIFNKQISQKRLNYSPKISNYFKLYFKKYA